MEFESFHWLSHHGIWAIIPWSTKRESVLRDILGLFGFYFSLVFYIFWAFLIKQLFHSRLLDMRWLWPTRRYAPRWLSIISYPTRAHGIIVNYNIAGRATQSNSVYVNVLQISTVLTDGVSKSLCQKFFFARAAIVSAGIQRLGPLVSKQTHFSGFNSWARVFKWGTKRKKQRKRKLSISAVTIRFTDSKTLS